MLRRWNVQLLRHTWLVHAPSNERRRHDCSCTNSDFVVASLVLFISSFYTRIIQFIRYYLLISNYNGWKWDQFMTKRCFVLLYFFTCWFLCLRMYIFVCVWVSDRSFFSLSYPEIHHDIPTIFTANKYSIFFHIPTPQCQSVNWEKIAP